MSDVSQISKILISTQAQVNVRLAPHCVEMIYVTTLPMNQTLLPGRLLLVIIKRRFLRPYRANGEGVGPYITPNPWSVLQFQQVGVRWSLLKGGIRLEMLSGPTTRGVLFLKVQSFNLLSKRKRKFSYFQRV